MDKCELCGNQYDKCFKIIMKDKTHIFDCFECAIQSLAPLCTNCKCRIIGHGLEERGKYYCCVHCAKIEGSTVLRDRA
jgi:hypothetical protein